MIEEKQKSRLIRTLLTVLRNSERISGTPKNFFEIFDRKEYWNLELDKVEETVRTGIIFGNKCEKPNKICFKRYFGKENVTYTVIARYHQDFIEVKTAWPKKGR